MNIIDCKLCMTEDASRAGVAMFLGMRRGARRQSLVRTLSIWASTETLHAEKLETTGERFTLVYLTLLEWTLEPIIKAST